jgi:hypothetical protein
MKIQNQYFINQFFIQIKIISYEKEFLLPDLFVAVLFVLMQ